MPSTENAGRDDTPLVSLARQTDYDLQALAQTITDLLEPLGGFARFVRSGQRVILKPNLVLPCSPDKAATTHPAVVRVVAELALQHGAQVAIGDSPGMGTSLKSAKAGGVFDALTDLDVSWIEFTPADISLEDNRYKHHCLSRELLDADVVINLPKLKTHAQMLMTMAVKNMFGAVVGFRKFEWHYRAGRDRLAFARMLHEVCTTIHPALTIVDAVVAMDGRGPTSGNPNATGFMAAGTDPCAVDAVLLDILDIPRERLWTLQAARLSGDTAWEHVRTTGAAPSSLTPERWDLPENESLAMHGPPFIKDSKWLARFMRKQVSALPHVREERCVRCGACVKICPAHAMTLREDAIRIDYDACIQCYCCDELCPHDAIELEKGILGRLLDRLS